MKLLLTTAITLGAFTLLGCDNESGPATTTRSNESHVEDDGHDHAGEPEGGHAEDGDHSGHDH